MSLLRLFTRAFDPEFRAAREKAIGHIRAGHLDWRVVNAAVRAEEPDRFVFAVFYQESGLRVVPGRYAIVAVGRRNGSVEDLPLSPQSPYRIRGLK